MYNAVFFGVSGTSSQSVANSATFIINLSPALWLDAADTSTLTVTNNAVSQWRDKSTNLRHISQTTGTSQPIYNSIGLNGNPALIFDGVNDSLFRDGQTLPDFGVTFIVFQFNRIAGIESVITTDNFGSAPRLFIRGDSGTLQGYSSGYFNAGSYTTAAAEIIAFEQITGVSRIYRSGTVTGSLSQVSGTNSGFMISRPSAIIYANPSAISVAEIISVPNLSNSDRQAIEGYLAWKWGLVASLPSDHPYKNTAPFALLSITANNTIAVLQLNQPTALTFTVNRSGVLTGQTTVNYVVSGSGSSPAVASEFSGTFPSGSVTFAPNETIKTISVTVTITSNTPTKEFAVTLSNPVNADIVNGSAVSSFRSSYSVANSTILGFTPALWLDAADISTLTITNNTVSQWRDKSGNVRNANQVTAANQPVYNSTPVNGLPSLQFNGNQQMFCGNVLNLDSLNQFSIMVFRSTKTTPTGTASCLYSKELAAHGYSTWVGTNLSVLASILRATNGTQTEAIVNEDILNRSVIGGAIIQNGSNHRVHLNGVLGNPTTDTELRTSNTRPFRIGAFDTDTGFPHWFVGQIAEIIILRYIPTTENRQRLEGYLAWKWGLVASLPSNHPYKNTPPY